MHTAPSVTTAQLPHHLVARIGGITASLADLGIAVQYTSDVPAEDGARLDEEAGVLWIRDDLGIEDRLWLLRDCWDLLTFGPEAAPFAQVLPRLRLVIPDQRAEPDEQPA